MKHIILFDGVCGLCNSVINLLIKLDHNKVFKYTSLQGEYGKSLNIDSELDSIIFYSEGELLYKSTAVLKIFKTLGGVWYLTQIFYVIPKVMRDYMYDTIARYRYKIFGKMEDCQIAEEKDTRIFLP